jgi:hypothetical protein
MSLWTAEGKDWEILQRAASKYPWYRHRIYPGVVASHIVMERLVEQGHMTLTGTEPSGVKLYAITDVGRKHVAACLAQKRDAANGSPAASAGGAM